MLNQVFIDKYGWAYDVPPISEWDLTPYYAHLRDAGDITQEEYEAFVSRGFRRYLVDHLLDDHCPYTVDEQVAIFKHDI